MFEDIQFLRFPFAFVQALLKMTEVVRTQVWEAIAEAYSTGFEAGNNEGGRDGYGRGYDAAKRDFGPRSFVPTYALRDYLRGKLAVLDTSYFVFYDNDVRTEFWDFLHGGQLIPAIKALREHTNLGLKDAKDVCDAVRGHMKFAGYLPSAA